LQLRIESKDSFGDEFDNVYSAEKHSGEKGRKYTYMDEHGETLIYVLKDSVNIVRNGEIKSTQTLKEGARTKFTYKTSYLLREFTVYTKKLNIENKKIKISYSIYDGEELLNDIEMSIKEIKNS